MKQEINLEVKIPEDVEINVDGDTIVVKSGNFENSKKFNLKNIEIKKSDNLIILHSKKATKKELKMINTINAHIKNMIAGIKDKFTYVLEIAYLHFPVTVEYDKNKNILLIKNFLGEKKPRSCKILDGVGVSIEKNKIILSSHNKELAGQTAANIERATHIRNRDRRKFQDGIYIIEKPRRVL
ncbi:MAG: 50S ribosomal protein L6 [Candidatus Pacearchaeota archaeon]